jgi:serine/threonine protein kinase
MSPAQPALQGRPHRVQLDKVEYEVTDVRPGGMGKVWLLRRPGNTTTIYGTTLAVKTFGADEDEQEGTIEQELGNWVDLHSPHIVPLIKIARLNFELAAMMELMPGSLADYIRVHSSLETSAVKTVLLDVLRGLDAARRQKNLAHLDLKPANLLLTSTHSTHVKISDWGISRLMSQYQQHADWLSAAKAWFGRQTDDKTQFCSGTYPYMAPERFSGSWTVGPAADIFSLGMIGVQLMTGKLPSFDGGPDPLRCVALIMSHEYQNRAKSLLATHGGPLVPFIFKMLDPDPNRRPDDYPALIAELERI